MSESGTQTNEDIMEQIIQQLKGMDFEDENDRHRAKRRLVSAISTNLVQEPTNFYRLNGNDRSYDSRRDHVISLLWQKQDEVRQLKDLAYEELCPPIYTRDDEGWKKSTYDKDKKEKKKTSNFKCENGTNITWITNKPIKSHIESKSKEGDISGEMQLYWAVFEENEAMEHKSKNGKHDEDDPSTDPKTIQLYIGKAKNGISQRWLGSLQSSHCKQMEKARDILSSMLEFNSTLLESFQLVDLRLLLHKACNCGGNSDNRGGNSGLFIIENAEYQSKEINDCKTQIESKKEEIKKLKKEKATLQDKIDHHEEKLKALEDERKALEKKLKDLEGELKALEEQQTDLEKQQTDLEDQQIVLKNQRHILRNQQVELEREQVELEGQRLYLENKQKALEKEQKHLENKRLGYIESEYIKEWKTVDMNRGLNGT